MPLTAGEKLGPYEILSPLGAGGMGEVYRARDKKLGREVAIKVLPEEFTQHPQKLARFEREARLLATLNHPGIATLYGVEESEGKPFLVMELVEGETLAERIARAPVPVNEALEISRQIAEALEAAHEKGVIHRDLKPANLKVDPEGLVKVLDFGLAKAFAEEVPESELSRSPTLSRDATRAGVILGTAAYMSPEQAKGKTVDKRTDIFSFGIVLYEMLTGKKAFAGEDVPEVLASVIGKEPDWEAVPSVEARIHKLLRQCLRKDRKNRRQSIGDVRVEIQDILAEPTDGSRLSAPKPTIWRLIGTPVAVALLLSGVVAVAVWNLKPEPVGRLLRVVATPPSAPPLYLTTDPAVAITPNGTRMVYSAYLDGTSQLVVRALDRLETTALTGHGLGNPARQPFISPDGNWVGYFAGSTLQKVSILGGPPVAICELPGRLAPHGASWGPDDTIVFAVSEQGGLWRVPARGGEPEELTSPDPQQGNHRWPEILPGGEAVLFTITSGSLENAQIAVLSLVTGEIQVLIPGGSNPRYATTGHIVYGAGGTLQAVGFDLERLEVTGDPVLVLDGVVTKSTGAADFSISLDGSLVYGSGELGLGAQRTLLWVDRQGQEQPLIDEPAEYVDVRLSPDGTKVAADMIASPDSSRNVWIYEVKGGRRTRLTASGGTHPVWTPDGTRVAFGTGGYLYWIPADGSGEAEPLWTNEHGLEDRYAQRPDSWSPDGNVLAFSDDRGSSSGRDIWMLPRDGRPSPFLATPYTEDGPMFSPDGRWLAYVSDASGRPEVYVQPYPGPGRKYPISTGGGRAPTWSGKGNELFYRSLDATRMMAVPVELEPEFRAGTPQILFEGRYVAVPSNYGDAHYDVAPDGQRFLMIKEGDGASEESPPELILVQNWHQELKRLVPTN